jgi:hypothetical protein
MLFSPMERTLRWCDRSEEFLFFPWEAGSVRVTFFTLKQMRLSRQPNGSQAVFSWQSRSQLRSEPLLCDGGSHSVGVTGKWRNFGLSLGKHAPSV